MVFLVSCTTSQPSMPISTGKNAEILINTNKNIWESAVGDTIRSVFMTSQIGLNQPEPMFRFLHIPELDKLLQKHRNILHVSIEPTIEKATVKYQKDVFAHPQTFIAIKAPSANELIKTIHKVKNILSEKFRATDYLRIQRAYKMQENKIIVNKLLNNFGYSLVIPESFYIAKIQNDFAWLKLETNRYSQAILIYEQEFTNPNILNEEFIINWRNKITKHHITGKIDGSYMTTDTIIAPVFQNVEFAGNEAIEVRGLWRTVGDFMGGPFITYVFKHPKEDKLIALEGYVYYPNQDKRDLMLQLEGILHSIKFVKGKR